MLIQHLFTNTQNNHCVVVAQTTNRVTILTEKGTVYEVSKSTFFSYFKNNSYTMVNKFVQDHPKLLSLLEDYNSNNISTNILSKYNKNNNKKLLIIK